MGGEWVEVRIKDIVTVVGGSTPSTKDALNFGGDIPWLTPKDLSGTHPRYVSRGNRNLSLKGLHRCSATLLPKNTVLLTTRAPIGYVALSANPIATNQGFRSLIVKPEFDHEFLYYWLKVNKTKLERHASGSTFKELSGTALKNIAIRLPTSKAEQRAIAHILGSLDDKIELNQQMAQTLESIARAIFKSWFVDFDPVKAKMEGKQPEGMSEEVAALFPDKFVESKLGMIPEGWASGKFSDISENIRINIRKDAINPNDCYIGLEHIPRKSLFLNNWGIGADVTSNKHRFLRYDLLFGKLRPYFHKIIIAPFNGICSTDILVIRSLEPHWYSLMTLGLSQKSVVDNVTNQSEGTRMPRTNWNQVGSQPIVIPSKKVAIAFDALILPMLQRVVEMAHENRHLSELRDTQLPRLISGKIRVNQPEDAAA